MNNLNHFITHITFYSIAALILTGCGQTQVAKTPAPEQRTLQVFKIDTSTRATPRPNGSSTSTPIRMCGCDSRACSTTCVPFEYATPARSSGSARPGPTSRCSVATRPTSKARSGSTSSWRAEPAGDRIGRRRAHWRAARRRLSAVAGHDAERTCSGHDHVGV